MSEPKLWNLPEGRCCGDGEEHTGLEGPGENKCSNVSDSFGSGSRKFTFKETGWVRIKIK